MTLCFLAHPVAEARACVLAATHGGAARQRGGTFAVDFGARGEGVGLQDIV
jgi:hypothetical protein